MSRLHVRLKQLNYFWCLTFVIWRIVFRFLNDIVVFLKYLGKFSGILERAGRVMVIWSFQIFKSLINSSLNGLYMRAELEVGIEMRWGHRHLWMLWSKIDLGKLAHLYAIRIQIFERFWPSSPLRNAKTVQIPKVC